MTDQAIKTSKDINYILMEISSKQEIVMLIKNLSNFLSEYGKMIFIVASNDLYIQN